MGLAENLLQTNVIWHEYLKFLLKTVEYASVILFLERKAAQSGK